MMCTPVIYDKECIKIWLNFKCGKRINRYGSPF